jgi:hypothetical protein
LALLPAYSRAMPTISAASTLIYYRIYYPTPWDETKRGGI